MLYRLLMFVNTNFSILTLTNTTKTSYSALLTSSNTKSFFRLSYHLVFSLYLSFSLKLHYTFPQKILDSFVSSIIFVIAQT